MRLLSPLAYRLLLLSGLLLAIWLAVRGVWSAWPSGALGWQNGQLQPCPATPNCVATQSAGGYPPAEPIPYTGDATQAQAQLAALLGAMPRVQLERQAAGYLHATFTSRFMGFVDDVEFLFDDEASVIHFRSASRVGQGDLGVNGRRMEALRAAFIAVNNPTP